MRLVIAIAGACFLAACPGARVEIIPNLPGDGDAHTAKPKPPPPDAEPAEPDDPWADAELIATPAAQPPAAIDLPNIERFKLKNGLSVIVVKSDELPVVDMQLAIKAGRGDVPRGKTGLAQFTAWMLSKGTRTRDALSIARSIDYVGGSLVANASFEATLISCSVQSKNLRTCLSLLPDVIVNSTFPEAEMGEIRKRLLATVRQRKDDASQTASVHLQNLLWGEDHARGWPMSPRSIAAITRKDLRDWHRKRFAPTNAVLAVSGNVDTRRLKLDLERAFRWWYARKVPKRATFADPAQTGVKVRLVDKPRQTQSHIRVGQLGIAHKDPAFYDHLVFNYVLGGGAFSSRLMKVVRSEAGKAYGASSYFDRNLDRGAFVVSTFTRSAETLATVKLLLGEIDKMKAQGPTDAEVGDAITHLAGNYATRFESSSAIASALLGAELHGLDDAYVRNYPLEVAKVTADSARKAAATTLDPKHLSIVIVGDATQVEPQLKAAGLAYDKIGHLQPVAAYERGGQDTPADPKAENAGRKLLDQALAAKGGAAKLTAISRMTIVAEGKIKVGGQEFPATMTRRFMAPDKLRMDIDLKVGGGVAKVVTVLNGDKGWNKQPQTGLIELPPDAVAELSKQIWRDQEFILLRHKVQGTRVEALGDKQVGGKTYDAVSITRKDGVSSTLYLDKKTHLPAGMTYSDQGIDGVESYADYKPKGGVQIAHRRATRNPQATIEVTVTSVIFNDKMDEALFSKPE